MSVGQKNRPHSIYEDICVTYVYTATMRMIRSAAGMKRYVCRNIVISLENTVFFELTGGNCSG